MVVHNFRPGVDAKLGLDAHTVRQDRPRLAYVATSGFGTVGPYGGRPAYDHVVQAMSGMAAIQGGDGEPRLIRNGVVDKITGLSATQAITAALLQRASTGAGQELEVQMLGVATAFLWPDGLMDRTVIGRARHRPANSRQRRGAST